MIAERSLYSTESSGIQADDVHSVVLYLQFSRGDFYRGGEQWGTYLKIFYRLCLKEAQAFPCTLCWLKLNFMPPFNCKGDWEIHFNCILRKKTDIGEQPVISNIPTLNPFFLIWQGFTPVSNISLSQHSCLPSL